ncbi:ABC transporter permease [Microtetraspora sp. AC03309]|uniref:ABC transporter permease n=1 Tax=Microtetraspora sp. AC03309 TaxID=2779376 RepID=UPI001E5D4FD7|nr:ABC transporter permease [Microtetraspora sp. AC03309]MCC5574651.1 ABC transporter permease [Microtetraspora sp. AC03309]
MNTPVSSLAGAPTPASSPESRGSAGTHGSLAAWRERLSAQTLVLPLVLVVLVVGLSLASDVFFSGRNIQQLLVQGSVLAIIAVGLTFVIIGGDLDLSIGSNVALSGVVASYAMTTVSGSVLFGIFLGIGTGVAIGALNGLLTAYAKVPAFISTMGTGVVATGLALWMTKGLAVSGLPASFQSLTTTRILGLPSLVWWAVAVTAVGALALHRTSFGARVFATGGNRTAAYNVGIYPDRVRFWCLTIAGLCGGLGGVLMTSRVLASQPGAGTTMTLFATAAVIIGGTKISGGVGTMGLTVFGVLLIAIVQNGLSILGVEYALQQVAVGVVFVLAAAFAVFRRT